VAYLSGYSPSPGDLAYPEKLEMMENIAEHLARQQQDHQQGRITSSHFTFLGWESGQNQGLIGCILKLYRMIT